MKGVQVSNDCVAEQFEDNSNSADSDQGGKDQEWLKCMAKIINSTSHKKRKPVQPLNNEVKKEKKPYDFEIDGEEIKEEIPKVTEKEAKDVKPKLSLRVKPSVQDIEREKALKKIATKGVVQLFNAVRMQQKEIQEELKQVGPLDHRRDEVLNNINKRKFLDVLMSGKRAKSELVDNPVKDEYVKQEDDEEGGEKHNQKAQWSVLRDDFMTNKKLKHWDKEDSESDDGSED